MSLGPKIGWGSREMFLLCWSRRGTRWSDQVPSHQLRRGWAKKAYRLGRPNEDHNSNVSNAMVQPASITNQEANIARRWWYSYMVGWFLITSYSVGMMCQFSVFSDDPRCLAQTAGVPCNLHPQIFPSKCGHHSFGYQLHAARRRCVFMNSVPS